ncbi:hypothetical protein N7510_000540 [Penicillium lagena]|uniref:uncharacterized protein n=1 Tax=Penicillium lagena TaxID=94218 RepID=UPI00253F67BD|nr:uncharacterized protein N7510_000540 [Penicillium lagena]KAJ5624231.1 hypothetical protein N7510_000540 [Penicillium lagena]
MRSLWQFLGALVAASSLGQAQASSSTLETAEDVATALKSYGVDASTVNSLRSASNQTTEVACQIACSSLISLYGSQVLSPDTTAYNSFTGSFWSVQQEEVQPRCIFKPSKNTEVSAVVLVSRLTKCPFAAKSGGHAAFAGASNSPGGITIWFTDMNEVTLNADKSVASIGPGNVWGSVYEALEPYGLAVVGGRASSIGVGGFTTGGGISFYSNLYGWAIDNVESFEVVTASGLIVTATENKNSDLYWGLRGGGNNLGLVTKFNLYTCPSPMMVGDTRVFLETEFDPVINAFVNLVHEAPNDGNAQYYIAFLSTEGMNVASAELTYVKNVTNPPIYEQIRSIPAISDNTTSKTLVQYAEYIDSDNPNGLREVYWPISTYLNEELAKWTVDYFFSVIPQVANVTGAQPVLIYQALTEPMLKNMTKYGGNALGLEASKGPVHLMHVSFWWDDASDDETVYSWVGSFWDTVLAKAKDMGVYNEWVYMNYASQFQDVIAGYGAENKARLQQVAAKYDPEGVWQTLQPGYFKLTHAPVTKSP